MSHDEDDLGPLAAHSVSLRDALQAVVRLFYFRENSNMKRGMHGLKENLFEQNVFNFTCSSMSEKEILFYFIFLFVYYRDSAY